MTPRNVHRLAVTWLFQTGTPGRLQATPIVSDGVLYVSGVDNHVWAIDASTGRTIWHYKRVLPDGLIVCCGRVNRGLGVHGSRLYLTTLDAHLVALDMKTGSVLWESLIEDHTKGYAATVAPLVWVTGSYDPDLNLIYWGTGNPAPDSYGAVRKGDNLYADSVVALDADTGRLRWHYQFTPHDVHDWDSAQVPVLADLTIDGARRKALLFANRNGFFYVLDRTDGTLLRAKPFVNTTWAKEIGRNGRPVLLPNNDIAEGGTVTCPDVVGATNWMSPSFNPATGLLYVTTREACARYHAWPQEFQERRVYWGGAFEELPGGYGALRALDPVSGDLIWEFRYVKPSMGGTLTTASGLVFAGEEDGHVMAFDARTGKSLWHFQTGAAVTAAPVTYLHEGRQYVLIGSGTNLIAFALP